MIRFALLCVVSVYALAAAELRVDTDKRFQTIEGFGTCLVNWTKEARAGYYDDEMAKIYIEDMGFNILRENVAPWGHPKTENADEISKDKLILDLKIKGNSRIKVAMDFAKKLKKLDPEFRLIGSVWSPPAWMKYNNNVTGGKGKKREPGIHSYTYKRGKKETRNRVIPKYYQHYCNLLAEVCIMHKEHGIPFYALSPGNEVRFSQEFESCTWTAKDFATIIAMLGKTLEEKGFGEILLFGPETMTKHNHKEGNLTYIKEMKKNKEALVQLDRFATHGYVDGFKVDMSSDSSTDFWNLIKDTGKPAWMTEGGTGGHTWPEPIGGVATGVHNSLVYGHTSAFVPWQVSSPGGKENTHALMPAKRFTKKTRCMQQYSKFIDAGAVRVDARCDNSGILSSAFIHDKKNKLTIVMINTTEAEQTVTAKIPSTKFKSFKIYRTSEHEDLKELEALKVKQNSVAFKMPGPSVVTLVSN